MQQIKGNPSQYNLLKSIANEFIERAEQYVVLLQPFALFDIS
jgi:hypothetical protein